MTEGAAPDTGPATQQSGPFSFNEVLLAELQALRPDDALFKDRRAVPIRDAVDPNANEQELARSNDLRDIYQKIGSLSQEKRLSALCFSGGGIRSATFNLGVIQGLARLQLLDKFDYLSTVSGGGFIGGWLKAWMRRAGTTRVQDELASRTPPEQPLKPEPRPVDRLREYSNYLTPRRGLFSGDSGAIAAIVIRNLLLIWLVVIPVLMAALALPQIYYLSTLLEGRAGLANWMLATAMGLALLTSMATHRFRRQEDRQPPRRILRAAVLPFVVSATLLSIGANWLDWSGEFSTSFVLFIAAWCILIPLAGWSLQEPSWARKRGQPFPMRELLSLLGSGTVGAFVLGLLALSAYPYLQDRPPLYAWLAVPALIGVYLLARALFVGMAETRLPPSASVSQQTGANEDLDREWWARLSGYLLMIAVGWLLVLALGLLGWPLAYQALGDYVLEATGSAGIVSGLVALLLGKSADTGSGSNRKLRAKGWVLGFAAPLFCATIVLVLAHVNVVLGRALTGNAGLLDVMAGLQGLAGTTVLRIDLLQFVLYAVVLLAFGFAVGRVVNVNRFSLHGMYRNRLIRAYLGASNPTRKADPFTGFSANDNIKMHDLWHAPVPDAGAGIDCRRPLHVVNTTLNLVRGSRLAWQERKSESFSITPFFCGNFYEGYRLSREYGGPGGITLGTAMTISGAAANPNMGHHSSPPITFLLGILNGRLGAWLGNTNANGEDTFQQQGPRWAVRPLFAELFGLTSNQSRYIQLSDGGHFDNLGLYEMVLRRCRFILVCDAGRDPNIGYEDLGNAIRKIRIDFGVPIEFENQIRIRPRADKETGLYCAIGSIKYGEVDGQLAAPGTLIYLKPTLRGEGAPIPYDVVSYSNAPGSDFPHESTSDQWFDESQFESYRALGRHAISQVTAGASDSMTLADLEAAVRRHVMNAAHAAAAAPAVVPGAVPA